MGMILDQMKAKKEKHYKLMQELGETRGKYNNYSCTYEFKDSSDAELYADYRDEYQTLCDIVYQLETQAF